MVINKNVEAEATKHNLAVTQTNLAKSLSRLSSGTKIVTPSDDAAGLAVSNRLEAQIKRIDSALSNVVNATSWTQTQDGFMKNISTAFRRMSELAMLAQDATKSNEDRDLYNKELQELKNFVIDSSKQDYNGVSLFAGVSLDVTVNSEGTTFGMASIDLGGYEYSRAVNSGKDAWKLSSDAYQLSKDGFTLKNTGYKTSVDLWRDTSGNWSKADNGGTKIKAGSIVTEDVGSVDTNVTVYAAGTFVNSENAAVAVKGFKVDAENNKLVLAENHGLANGDAIKFNGSAPAGLTAGETYYAKKLDANNIEVYTDKTLINKVNMYHQTEVTNVSVTAADNTFTKQNHGLSTGDAVVFNDASNIPAGAAANTVYFVNKVTKDTFKLYTDAVKADAGGAAGLVGITSDGANLKVESNVLNGITTNATTESWSKTGHGMTDGDVVQVVNAGTAPANLPVMSAGGAAFAHSTDAHVKVTSNSSFDLYKRKVDGISINTNSTTFSKTGHGLANGTEVQFLKKAPDGAGYTASYYVKQIDANSFTLHATASDATAGTNKVSISSDYTDLTLVTDKVLITTASTGEAYLKLKQVGAYNVDDHSVTAGKDNANIVKRGYFVSVDPSTNGEDTRAVKIKSGEIVSINQSDQDISAFATKQGGDYKDINVKTIAGAKIALEMIKKAITKVATDRAGLGATQSRLNFTNDQLNITKENLSAAISRITDVDVAEEATSYARYQILVATGTQMLKQANQLPQGAIELLR